MPRDIKEQQEEIGTSMNRRCIKKQQECHKKARNIKEQQEHHETAGIDRYIRNSKEQQDQ